MSAPLTRSSKPLAKEIDVEGIPPVNIAAVVHLCFVAAFFGLYCAETVVETYYSKKDEQHPIAIRCHYLMDIFVEIPLMAGILVSGVILAILVDELTTLHIILITCGTLTVLGCVFNWYVFVRSRNLVIEKETIDYDLLNRIRKRLTVYVIAVFNPLLIATMIIGFWLAYHRMLESIYG